MQSELKTHWRVLGGGATGVGAVSVASVRDATGSFDAALPVVAVLFVAGAMLLLALGRTCEESATPGDRVQAGTGHTGMGVD